MLRRWILILALTNLGLQARAEKALGFSRSKPYCDSFFFRATPEIVSFKAAMVKEQRYINAMGRRKSEYVVHYFINLLDLGQEVLKAPPFSDQGPHVRSILISWFLTNFIEYYRVPKRDLEFQKFVLDQFDKFMNAFITGNDPYELVDLQRLRRSLEIFFSRFFEPRALIRIQEYFDRLDRQIRILVLKSADGYVALPQIAEMTTAQGILHKPGSLLALANSLVLSLRESGVPAERCSVLMGSWIMELSVVNRVHWTEIVGMFHSFRLYAMEIGMTETAWQNVIDPMREITSKWDDNPDASRAARLEIEAGAKANLLPAQTAAN